MVGRDCYAVFEAMRSDLVAMARKITRSTRARVTAEDIVQAFLARLWERALAGDLDCDAIASPRAYAYTALSRQFLDEIRRPYRRDEVLHLDDTIRDEAAAPSSDPNDARKALRCLGALDEKDRTFLLRVVVEGGKVEAVKRELGWPPGAPHYHLRKLLAQLRACLEGNGGDR